MGLDANDITVTKFLETALANFLLDDGAVSEMLKENDISVTKFLGDENDISVTKFMDAEDNGDISVTKFMDSDNGDISVTKFLDSAMQFLAEEDTRFDFLQ